MSLFKSTPRINDPEARPWYKRLGTDKGLAYGGIVATVAVSVFLFFFPTYHEVMAFPATWVDKETRSHVVKIHKSDNLIQEEGELPFLLLGNPYTSKFLCQLQKTGSSWQGRCNYTFSLLAADFTCQVQTNEMITGISGTKISGYSQELEPPKVAKQCPVPRGGPEGKSTTPFELVPAD
jgi:hypothetical protein